jgi:DNA repair protein RecO (recombination protein O)
MSGTYKAIGINLKSTPLGEADRLLTILTEEHGLLRAVAPGSRKHKSSLGGRSSVFVVNQLLLVKGRNLDKVIQAESLESYPGLSQDLRKLTAGQYLAELAFYQALSNQPQVELFRLLRQTLKWLEQLPTHLTLPCLTYATFHLLETAGIAPRVQTCCVTQQPVLPNFAESDWRIGFSTVAGGVISATADPPPDLSAQLTAAELAVLQQLAKPDLLKNLTESELAFSPFNHPQSWLSIERILRNYAQYHFDRPIRSAALIDTCFASIPVSSPIKYHDAIL